MDRSALEKVRSSLPEEELLCQLAEEATELAHAALKLRRAVVKKNFTPVSVGDAVDNLLEELADVQVCCIALDLEYARLEVEKTVCVKLERWAKRLEESEVKADEQG